VFKGEFLDGIHYARLIVAEAIMTGRSLEWVERELCKAYDSEADPKSDIIPAPPYDR
jgi:hypothetical protein